jgi:hypothetical protein
MVCKEMKQTSGGLSMAKKSKRRVEPTLRQYLESKGWYVEKGGLTKTGVLADLIAGKSRKTWLIEVKDVQASTGGIYNRVLLGAAQLVASKGASTAKLSLAGPPSLRKEAERFLGFISKNTGLEFTFLEVDINTTTVKEIRCKPTVPLTGKIGKTNAMENDCIHSGYPWGRDHRPHCERNYRKTYKGKSYTMRVSKNGKCSVGDVGTFDTPSAAGKAITGNPTNGYVFWKMDE